LTEPEVNDFGEKSYFHLEIKSKKRLNLFVFYFLGEHTFRPENMLQN